MPYETIDKGDSINSVENHIYDHKDDSRKIKPKIAVESWTKRKKRNYYYQVKSNLKSKWRISFKQPKENEKNIDRKKENKNFQSIKPFQWGGSVITERNKTVTMVQTCPVDNLLFILKYAFEENSNLKQTFLSMEGISDIVDYLISDNYNEAKYQWLSLCKPFVKITRIQWNAEGTDKNLGTIPSKQYLKRIYIYTCTSERCPSQQNDVNIE